MRVEAVAAMAAGAGIDRATSGGRCEGVSAAAMLVVPKHPPPWSVRQPAWQAEGHD